MKKIIALLLILAMVFTLAACGKDGNTDEDADKINRGEIGNDNNDNSDKTDGDNTNENDSWDAILNSGYEPINYLTDDISGNVKLGSYTGLTAEHVDSTVTDEEFVEYINSVFAMYEDYEHITDRPVVEGDKVVVDYSGVSDGMAFAGGTAVDQEIIAADGMGTIPGFGPSLIGHMPGDTYSVDITFPEDYGNSDMAGVLATFTFRVKYIKGDNKVCPTYDTATDSFIYDEFGYNTLAEFLTEARHLVELQKEYTCRQNTYRDLLAQIVETSEVTGYENEVNYGYASYRQMYEYYASLYQVDYEAFLTEYAETSDEELYEYCHDIVVENFVFYSLVKELGIEVTQDEIDELTAYIGDMYGITSAEVVSQFTEDGLKSQVLFDKAMEQVASLGNIVEVPAPTESDK